jgi:hypothetical protein
MGNWEHHKMTNDELKELVKNVFDCKVFTTLQCSNSDAIIVFMPAMFIGASPRIPNIIGNIKVDRKNKLNYIDAITEYKNDTPKREEYLKSIGMLYEEYSNAGPTNINGFPCFFSCNIVSIEDTIRFKEMYGKYEEMRTQFENEWGNEEVKSDVE